VTAREAEAGRVLVVEDDESTALFVTLVLKRHGFDASWVMDAEQASQRLEDERFDVLLADCRLPGQSGVDLARATRLAQPGMGIAVMTSYAEADTETTARSNGADDFFGKPLHSSNLVTRIGALVSRSRASGSSESPPARGAIAQAMPVDPAPVAAPSGVAPGPEVVADSGPEKQAETRDSGLAQQDAHWSGVDRRFEGAGGPSRARSSALSEDRLPQNSPSPDGLALDGTAQLNAEREVSGCGEHQSEHPGGGSGPNDLNPSAEVPAEALGQDPLPVNSQPVLMWASTAPAAPITSTLGPVANPGTGPDWWMEG
jgi:CheY-like chemotaxis protein